MEIAGTPRNSFRASLMVESIGGKALNECGRVTVYQAQSNSEYQYIIHRSQTTTDKGRGQEGKSPDRQLRSLMVC